MTLLVHWLFCVLLSVGVVALAVWLRGYDTAWVGRHLGALCLVAFALSVTALWGGSKPPPTPPVPTVKGLTLAKPITSPNDTTLRWWRDDGSNSVGKTYQVQKAEGSGTFSTVAIVPGANSPTNSATVNGFHIDRAIRWRIMEEATE